MSILTKILFLSAASFWLLLTPITSWMETFEGNEIAPDSSVSKGIKRTKYINHFKF